MKTLLDWSRGKKRTTYRGGTEKPGIQRGWAQRTAYRESLHRSTPGQSNQPASSMSPWCEGTTRHQSLLFDTVTINVAINRDGFILLPPNGGKQYSWDIVKVWSLLWTRNQSSSHHPVHATYKHVYANGLCTVSVDMTYTNDIYTWPIYISIHLSYTQYL